MRISKDTVRLLRWMNKDDEWRYITDLEKKCKHFSYRNFNALKSNGFIDKCTFEDEVLEYDEYYNAYFPEHYRISDQGKAYLEALTSSRIPELREWIAIGISVLALIVSVIALIAGLS